MKNIKYAISLLVTIVAMLSACVNEEIVQNSQGIYQGDGRSVNVVLQYCAMQSAAVSRVLSDDAERQVNDIMVFAFPVASVNAQGEPVFDASKNVFKLLLSGKIIIFAHGYEFCFCGESKDNQKS